MIKTTGFQDVNFFSEEYGQGQRRHMLRGDFGREAGKRYFSRIGAYPGHVTSVDGWFSVRAGNKSDWFISSGVSVPSNRKNGGFGFTRSVSKETFRILWPLSVDINITTFE